MSNNLTPTKVNPKTGSAKIVTVKKGYRPTVRIVKGQGSYKLGMNWEHKVKHFRTIWEKEPELYSSRPEGVFNHEMSPKDYFSYYLAKNTIDIQTKRSNEPYPVQWIFKIANSILNRFPSEKGPYFKTRMGYSFCCVAGISDSNSFPMTLVDVSDEPDRKFPYLMLKDRGNWSYLISKGEEQILTVKQWRTLLKSLKTKKEFMDLKLENKRFKAILDNSISSLNSFTSHESSKKLSLKDVIGDEVWDEWWNCERAINVRVKFETLGVHTNEMQAFNNTETKWVLENFLLSTLNLAGFYDSDDYDIDSIQKIHALCIDGDDVGVFAGAGDILQDLKNKNQEGFESWFPIALAAFMSDDTWGTFIGNISRTKQKDGKKEVAWKKLFSKKNEQGMFKVFDEVKEVIDFIKIFDKLPGVDKYETEMDNQKENNGKLRRQDNTLIGNVKNNRMLLRHPDNVAILIRASYKLSKEIYKARDSISNRKHVLTKLLENAYKALRRGDLVKLDVDTSTLNRFKTFWDKIVIHETREELKSGKQNWDREGFWEALMKSLQDGAVGLYEGCLEVYDKDSHGVWVKHKINFLEMKGLDGCHMNPSGEETIDNMFLHLKGYNKDWGRKPIEDLQSFMSDVDSEVYDYANDNDLRNEKSGNHMAPYWNTQKLNEHVLKVFNELNS